MELIEKVLSGDLDVLQFLEMLNDSPELQSSVRDLLPQEAKNNPSHSFWKIVPYESLRQNHFDYYNFLFWAVNFDRKFGATLTIFNRLKKAYILNHSDVQCTKKYSEMFELYLDVVKDCFDGYEVHHVVERIIIDTMSITPKSKRVKVARMAVYTSFHVENNKRPRWIQGPEWPMGKNSPMLFSVQRQCGEFVEFVFHDVDTNEQRIIKQYY